MISDISGIMMGETRDQWVEFFSDSDICFTPVLDLDEVSEHEQVAAREMLYRVVNFRGGGTDLVVAGNPVKLSDTPCDVKLEFPDAGGNTEDILKDAGYTDSEIQDFIIGKIV